MNIYTYISVCAALTLCGVLNNKIANYLIIIWVALSLYLLPDTGYDYSIYQLCYESGIFTSEFPFFTTISSLTAEPLYKWYLALVHSLTSLSFQAFLVVNFMLSMTLYFSFYPNIGDRFFKYSHLYFALPVIVPTIFYWSPRSSISFFFILIAIFNIVNKGNILFTIGFMLVGSSLHSQYMLACVYILSCVYLNDKNKKNFIFFNIFLAFLLAIIMKLFPYIYVYVSKLLSYLPHGQFVLSKLTYLLPDRLGEREGGRISSIFTIAVYPVLSVLLYQRRYGIVKMYSLNKDVFDRLCRMFIYITFLGAAVSVVYLDSPHVAGRLSRFSDYTSTFIMLTFYLSFFRRYRLFIPVVGVFLMFLSVLIYPSLYS